MAEKSRSRLAGESVPPIAVNSTRRLGIPQRNGDVRRFSRALEDYLGVAIKGLAIKLRVYANKKNTMVDPGYSLAESGIRNSLHQSSRLSVPVVEAAVAVVDATKTAVIPDLRASILVQELVLWSTSTGKRSRKVLGAAKSSTKTKDNIPFINTSIIGYQMGAAVTTTMNNPEGNNTETHANKTNKTNIDADNWEYRVNVSFEPVRLFLDEQVLEFMKVLSECQECIDFVNSNNSNLMIAARVDNDPIESKAQYQAHGDGDGNGGRSDIMSAEGSNNVDLLAQLGAPKPLNQRQSKAQRTPFYIQCISVSAIDVIIDYQPSILNIERLQQGDYLQLLNFFPLESMHLTLKAVKSTGVSSLATFFASSGEIWVHDIYEHQMFRVLSGAAPLKALSNISTSLQDLVLVPLNEYRKSQQVNTKMKTRNNKVANAIGQTTLKLLQTVSRETLDASHKLTMMLARGIESFAGATDPKSVNHLRTHENNRNQHHGASTSTSSAAGSSNRNTSSDITNPRNRPTRHRAISHESEPHNTLRKIGDEWENQPATVGDGLRRGYSSLSREVTSAVDTIVTLPLKQYRRSGSRGELIQTVVTALPIAILRPIAGTAEALSYTLLGLRNNIDPSARAADEDIWNHQLFGSGDIDNPSDRSADDDRR